MSFILAALLLASSPEAARSLRITAQAEKLLEFEKKMAVDAEDPIDDLLFGDVLGLLDVAVSENPGNLHARALRSQVLLHHAYNADDDNYDVCDLMDARKDAEFVISKGTRAAAADLTIARTVIKNIGKIPPGAIPDPPSACNDDDEGHSGTPTKN